VDKKLLVPEIKERFRYYREFTSKELYDFYKLNEPELKENTLRWRIWKLKQDNIITSIKRGVYSLDNGDTFKPAISNKIKSIDRKINKQFPYAEYCIWETKWLNNFMIHQPGSYLTILEVEKDAIDTIFSYLKSYERNAQLYKVIKNYTDLYIHSDETIVIKTLSSRAPIAEYDEIKIPKLEKILVDLFVDKELYNTYQGLELENIYANVLNNYSINYTTLLNYASRRNSKETIKKYIGSNYQINDKYIWRGIGD
jgi:hypothetical protein